MMLNILKFALKRYFNMVLNKYSSAGLNILSAQGIKQILLRKRANICYLIEYLFKCMLLHMASHARIFRELQIYAKVGLRTISINTKANIKSRLLTTGFTISNNIYY